MKSGWSRSPIRNPFSIPKSARSWATGLSSGPPPKSPTRSQRSREPGPTSEQVIYIERLLRDRYTSYDYSIIEKLNVSSASSLIDELRDCPTIVKVNLLMDLRSQLGDVGTDISLMSRNDVENEISAKSKRLIEGAEISERMAARFDGMCKYCGLQIYAGTPIVKIPTIKIWIHETCARSH